MVNVPGNDLVSRERQQKKKKNSQSAEGIKTNLVTLLSSLLFSFLFLSSSPLDVKMEEKQINGWRQFNFDGEEGTQRQDQDQDQACTKKLSVCISSIVLGVRSAVGRETCTTYFHLWRLLHTVCFG